MVKKFDTHLRFGRTLSLASLGFTLTFLAQIEPSCANCWCVSLDQNAPLRAPTYSCTEGKNPDYTTDSECNDWCRSCILPGFFVPIQISVAGGASKETCEAEIKKIQSH